MANPDYIFNESDVRIFEGPFTFEQHKWARTIEKRGRSLARWISPPRGRLRERIVENPLTLAALSSLPPGAPVADVGGASSLLGLELSYLGLKVQVLDLRPYPFRHPNLTTAQINLFDSDLPAGSFAAISCISVIEHVGLDRYGSRNQSADDLAFIRELKRISRPGGKIILSAPYGQGHDPATMGEPRGYRIYDKSRLARLCQGLSIRQLRFFAIKNGVWLEIDQTEADVVPTSRPINAIFWAEMSKNGRVG